MFSGQLLLLYLTRSTTTLDTILRYYTDGRFVNIAVCSMQMEYMFCIINNISSVLNKGRTGYS